MPAKNLYLILALCVAISQAGVIAKENTGSKKTEDPHNQMLKPSIPDNNQKWLSERIKEAKQIKSGMTQAELEHICSAEAGLQSIPPSRYVLKSCPLIKVDVGFKKIKDKNVVDTVSPIYIDYVVTD